VCFFLLSLNKFFNSLSSVLMKEIVLLKSWGGAVAGQSEVALSSYKSGACRDDSGVWGQIDEFD